MPTDFDYTKPFRQKNGRRAELERIIRVASYRLHVRYEDEYGNMLRGYFTEDGRFRIGQSLDCDLINIPQETVMQDFDPKKPVQQRNGRGARIRLTDAVGELPIVAECEDAYGKWHAQFRYENGRFSSGNNKHQFDLVNVPETREVWVKLFEGTDGFNRVAYGYGSHELSQSSHVGECIACVCVPITVGQFDQSKST